MKTSKILSLKNKPSRYIKKIPYRSEESNYFSGFDWRNISKWFFDSKYIKEEYNKNFFKIKTDNLDKVKDKSFRIVKNGDTFYYKEGKYHREDGPAVEHNDGTKSWWINGNLHREYGPAVEFSDGTKIWLINGVIHRADGPAFEFPNGTKFWYLNGVKYSKEDYDKTIQQFNKSKIIKKAFGDRVEYYNVEDQLQKKDVAAVSCEDPSKKWSINKEWRVNGELHREDGPAVEYNNGTKVWYVNGERHRENGHAIEYYDGIKCWYKNGDLHREDGPAIEFPTGAKSWYFDGVYYSEDSYNRKMQSLKFSKKTIETSGFFIEMSDGEKYWDLNNFSISDEEFNNLNDSSLVLSDQYIKEIENSCTKYFNDLGQLHRVDGPAVIWNNGNKEWWFNGKRHRKYGPAFIYNNGEKYWWFNNSLIKPTFFMKLIYFITSIFLKREILNVKLH